MLSRFNPQTYERSHIPTVVQTGGSGWTLPLGFVLLRQGKTDKFTLIG